MNFSLKGSQISVLQSKGWFKFNTSIQEYSDDIQNSYWTCAWIIWYMFPIQCEELRINHLTSLLVMTVSALRLLMLVTCKVYWRLQVTSSFSIRGCIWEGCFGRGIVWRAKSCSKGIEDFNLGTLSQLSLLIPDSILLTYSHGHFTHEAQSPWPLHFKHSLWWETWSRSESTSHYAWGTNGGSMWMQCKTDVKVYMDAYMASNGSRFMVTWTSIKNRLVEVGFT